MKFLMAVLFIFLLLPSSQAGDLMDEFSGYYHSPVVLEVGETLDAYGHPKNQWLLSVIRGENQEVAKVQKQFKIQKGPPGKLQRKRVLFYRLKGDGTAESMDLYMTGQPMSNQSKEYLAYKMWLLDFKNKIITAPHAVEEGGKKIIIIQDPLLCLNILNNAYFQKRYSERINRPGGFQLGGYGGAYQDQFQPLLRINCLK